jgi:hypothetical protein
MKTLLYSNYRLTYLASVENVAELEDRGLVSRSHPRSKLEAATISCSKQNIFFSSADRAASREKRGEETHTHSSTPWLGWVIIYQWRRTLTHSIARHSLYLRP